MAFISNSVGLGGVNNPSDVRTIQWLLIRANKIYSTRLFPSNPTIEENGQVDVATATAIKELIACRKKQFSSNSENLVIPSINLGVINTEPSETLINPDDANYKYLIKCSVSNDCFAPIEAKSDFNSNPLAHKALK